MSSCFKCKTQRTVSGLSGWKPRNRGLTRGSPWRPNHVLPGSYHLQGCRAILRPLARCSRLFLGHNSHLSEVRPPRPHVCPLTTHVHNEEVEPAPGVGEIVFEAIGHPLEQHLKHKDKGKHPVGIFQQGLHHGLLVKVIVFKDLEGREQNGRLPGITAPRPSGGEGPRQACPQALRQFQ